MKAQNLWVSVGRFYLVEYGHYKAAILQIQTKDEQLSPTGVGKHVRTAFTCILDGWLK